MNNNNLNPEYWKRLFPSYEKHMNLTGQLHALYMEKYGKKSKNIITKNIYEQGVERLHEKASEYPEYMNKFYGLHGIANRINMNKVTDGLHDEITEVIKNKRNGKAYGTFLKARKQNSGPGRLEGVVDAFKGTPERLIPEFLTGPNGPSNAFKKGFRNVTGGKNKKRVTRKRRIRRKKTKYSRKHKK